MPPCAVQVLDARPHQRIIGGGKGQLLDDHQPQRLALARRRLPRSSRCPAAPHCRRRGTPRSSCSRGASPCTSRRYGWPRDQRARSSAAPCAQRPVAREQHEGPAAARPRSAARAVSITARDVAGARRAPAGPAAGTAGSAARSRRGCRCAASAHRASPSRPVKCPKSSPSDSVAEVKIQAAARACKQRAKALRDIKRHEAQGEAPRRRLSSVRAPSSSSTAADARETAQPSFGARARQAARAATVRLRARAVACSCCSDSCERGPAPRSSAECSGRPARCGLADARPQRRAAAAGPPQPRQRSRRRAAHARRGRAGGAVRAAAPRADPSAAPRAGGCSLSAEELCREVRDLVRLIEDHGIGEPSRSPKPSSFSARSASSR